MAESPALARLERLYLLLEELGECQQAIGKVLRHGYDEYHPDRPTNNRQDLERELGDVLCAIGLLCNSGDLDAQKIDDARIAKSVSMYRYLHYNKRKE